MKTRSIFCVCWAVIISWQATGWTENTGRADIEALRRNYHANQWQLDRSMTEYRMLADRTDPADIGRTIKRLIFLKNKIDLLASDSARLLKRLESEGVHGTEAVTPASHALEYSKIMRAEEWRLLTLSQKETYIYEAFGRMEENGVFMMKLPFFYVEVMDRAASDPQNRGAVLDNLLLMSIYEAEPQARTKLRELLAGYFSAAHA